MGDDGRSWAAMFTILALAILMAFFGPEPAVESAVAEFVEAHGDEALMPHAETSVVASR